MLTQVYNFRSFSDLSRSVNVTLSSGQLAGSENVTVVLDMPLIVSSQLYIPGGQFYFESCACWARCHIRVRRRSRSREPSA